MDFFWSRYVLKVVSRSVFNRRIGFKNLVAGFDAVFTNGYTRSIDKSLDFLELRPQKEQTFVFLAMFSSFS